jgi:hypothetical protein
MTVRVNLQSDEYLKSDNLLSSFPSIDNESHIAAKLDMVTKVNARGVDQALDDSYLHQDSIKDTKRKGPS